MSGDIILVTDNILSKRNEVELHSAGFTIRRLRRHLATEDELIASLHGATGYILGGIETVTDNVIDSAEGSLRAIVYTSTDYRVYIPGHEAATKRGIAIANCPGADSAATAEYALTLMLAMVRNIFDIGRTGALTDVAAYSLDELRLGIIGLGRIGTNFAILLRGLGLREVSYFSRTRREDLEQGLQIRYLPMNTLLSACNVVTLFPARSAGVVLNSDALARIEDDGLLINVAYPEAVDSAALIHELKRGRLRAAYDFPPTDNVEEALALPPGRFFWSNEYAGYNTTSALRVIGDMATDSIQNLLKEGTDRHLVNPEYQDFRSHRAREIIL